MRRAFYPLTFPLTVGPGSISVAITLGVNTTRTHAVNFVAPVIAVALVALSIYLCYAFADRLARILGPTTMVVVLQLSAFLLVCIGVQILWNGASALLAELPAALGRG